MKQIKLSEQDIIELKNIINCLCSEDQETFYLGKSLLILKLGVDFYVPIRDVFIPFKPIIEMLSYYSPGMVTLPPYMSFKDSFVCSLLHFITTSKYYAVP